MNCPSKETLQDLIDGTLSEAVVAQVVRHVKSCNSCKRELIEINSVHEALDKVISEDPCPSLERLESYCRNALSETEMAGTKCHIELCSRCMSLVWAFQASGEELAEWQAREQVALKEFNAQSLGQETAQEVLKELLPGKMTMFDRTWSAVVAFVSKLKDKAIENWPVFSAGMPLVGALAFAADYDHEDEAALIILATTLYVSQAITDGEIKPNREDVESAVQEVAAKLGAGKQLRQRLMDTAVPIILRFKRDADA